MKRWVFLSVAALFLLAGPAAADREAWREQSEKTVQVRGVRTLEVVNARGRVELLPSPDGDLHITALKVVRRGGREAAQDVARRISVETGAKGDRYVVEVRYPRRHSVNISFWDLFRANGVSFPRYEVILTCQVPRGLGVSVRETSGDIRSKDLAADQVLKSTSGDIDVESAAGALQLSSTSGDVRASAIRGARVRTVSGDVVVRDVSGVLRAATTSGRITVTGARDSLALTSVSGDIRADRASRGAAANTSSGDVVLREIAGAVRIGTTSGDVRLFVEEPLESVEAGTSSGKIRLRLDPAVSCALDLRTSSGSINVDLPMRMNNVTRRSVTGSIRGGRAPVTLRTTSGDITIGEGGL